MWVTFAAVTLAVMVLFSCLCFPCWAARWRHFCFVPCSPLLIV
uniref:Uncharacterized protein n=1 Tax=Anguilla anguilla TaxID=7936 RepID=A0A0E9QW71_ANGAN